MTLSSKWWTICLLVFLFFPLLSQRRCFYFYQWSTRKGVNYNFFREDVENWLKKEQTFPTTYAGVVRYLTKALTVVGGKELLTITKNPDNLFYTLTLQGNGYYYRLSRQLATLMGLFHQSNGYVMRTSLWVTPNGKPSAQLRFSLQDDGSLRLQLFRDGAEWEAASDYAYSFSMAEFHPPYQLPVHEQTVEMSYMLTMAPYVLYPLAPTRYYLQTHWGSLSFANALQQHYGVDELPMHSSFTFNNVGESLVSSAFSSAIKDLSMTLQW